MVCYPVVVAYKKCTVKFLGILVHRSRAMLFWFALKISKIKINTHTTDRRKAPRSALNEKKKHRHELTLKKKIRKIILSIESVSKIGYNIFSAYYFKGHCSHFGKIIFFRKCAIYSTNYTCIIFKQAK